MSSLFPLSYPGATAFYLALYVMTLVVHVVFMNYVLAGSAYLAFVNVFPGPRRQRPRGLMALTLRDWLPFSVGVAITAGVAPLLFVQILYQPQFYTANLLLFHRWMSILPVLIVGAYLTYLLKSRYIADWPVAARTLVGVGAFACFAFTAYSWTENHLLSLQSQQTWSDFYGSPEVRYRDPQILPRLGVWFIGAFPTMAVLVSWQMYGASRRGEIVSPVMPRLAAAMAIAGLFGAGASGFFAWRTLSAEAHAALTSPACAPYLALAGFGAVAQMIAWIMTARDGRFKAVWLSVASAACLAAILGASVAREAVRLAAIDVTSLLTRHADAAKIGGLGVFLIFTAINTVLIIWCFRIVTHEMGRAKA